jgi:hypothetical protein
LSGLRGIDADWIVGEEASHMKPALFTTIIWPLAQVSDTVIVLISSPKDRNHYVSRLMLKTNPDDGSWALVLCSVSDVCADCLRHGRTEKQCSHQIATVPDHLSSTNARILEQMYDDKDMGAQELRGNPELREELVFKGLLPEFERMAREEPYFFREEVQVLYTFFDPSGGGGSNATLVTHAVGGLSGARVLVALDSCPRNETTEGTASKLQMIARHFACLRRDPRFRRAWVFVSIEANMSPDHANDVGRDILSHSAERVVILRRQVGQPTWMGVVTTAEEKRRWANYTSSLLAAGQLRVAKDLLGGAALDKLLPQLLDEMGQYRRRMEVVNEGKDNEHTRESFTGKVAGKQDDLVTAMLGSLWSHKVLVADTRDESEFYRVVNTHQLVFL